MVPSSRRSTRGRAAAGAWMYHGTRADLALLVDARGDLVLKPSKNFAGRVYGVSFTDDPACARDYAIRIKGAGPKGITYRNAKIIRIARAALPHIEREEMGEWADYTGRDVVVPTGQYWIEPVPRAQALLRDSHLEAGFRDYVRDNYRGLEYELAWNDPAATQERYLEEIVEYAGEHAPADVAEAQAILRDEFGRASTLPQSSAPMFAQGRARP